MGFWGHERAGALALTARIVSTGVRKCSDDSVFLEDSMPIQVGAYKAKTHLSQLPAVVERGQRVTITRRGRAPGEEKTSCHVDSGRLVCC